MGVSGLACAASLPLGKLSQVTYVTSKAAGYTIWPLNRSS